MRFRWVVAMYLAYGVVTVIAVRLLSSGAEKLWSGDRAVLLILVAAAAAAAVTLGVWRVHGGGDTVRGALRRRRQLARALVDTPGKLRARAPLAAGCLTLASFPAMFLALVAAPRAGGVQLPPAADARLQLWCVAVGAVVAIVGLGCWYGAGSLVRALVTDGFTASAVVFTVALAAVSPLMVAHHVESRGAWQGVAAAQFSWPLAGMFVCGAVSGRRKRRLYRRADMTVNSSVGSSAKPGIDGYYDLILESPGRRKIPVIQAIVTVTGMAVEEAMDLVDDAPGHVLRQVTGERADRAKNLLEGLGAVVTVSSDPGWD